MYKKGITTQFVIVIVLVLLIIAALVYGYFAGFGSLSFFSNSSRYQAVFITGDQVYFGNLTHERAHYPVLKNVYYLQVNQPIQPIQTDENGVLPQQPNIQLVKFGNELHGPTDEMRINRDHIILVEDLRDDSAVVQAIREYQISERNSDSQ